MKNVFKKALVARMSVFVAALLLASVSLRAAESGKCGDNITWTLDNTGTLVLTGSGAMYDYNNYSLWHDDRYDIKRVDISYGITSIGNHAFDGFENLTSMNLPSSVTSIGEFAFYDCKSLTSIDLPSSLTSICDSAFYGCQNLISIVIPNSVTSICDSAFYGCQNLISIVIPNGVESIGEGAFGYCESLRSIEITSGITSIEKYTFYGCQNLISIVIPNGVESIGEGAFGYCESLRSIEIPSGVESIGKEAFEHCTKLGGIIVDKGNRLYDSRNNCNAIIETRTNTLVAGCRNTVIPNRVESIGYAAFRGSGLTSIVIPNGVTSVDEYAFYNCADLESVTIGANVKSLGTCVFGSCPKLECIIVDKDNEKFDSRNNCNAIIEKRRDVLVAGCKNTMIPSSVIGIGYCAFYGCESIANIEIPNSVKWIGSEAFSHSGLTSIVIPDGVTSISTGAFHKCADLESVTLGANVEEIEHISFFGCNSLKRFELLGTVPPRAKDDRFDDDDVVVFDDDTYYTCQLVVPDEEIDVYRRTIPWAYFDHIAGVEDVIADGGVAVTADGNSIIVNGADDDAEVEVYSVSGALVYRGSSHSIAVPAAGIYVAHVAGKAVKVAVK